ncbi:A/G-specific adenine glycosylase [Arenimonas donghaensis]|uniref:Adenine DNA glycosylase n=1 Tax=Arenimonas donghaensis DSM 18148 = HO3-R19 TaxID=1121014 RepID=A0A087MIM2_9GAMM|nr:A/G-specific adenine glycosylase [Arenimonas donghaensis]KFL36725.1 hypothetical protein N788_03705 [Arenimonas donghaensis DSM 18148 = HO3-R19]
MSQFADRLLAWFDRDGRHDLPWQHPRTPYRVWLAEIMLQQTQVQTAIPYYTRFLDALPTLPDLAAADTDRVMALWAGLGYYARARNLHRAAQVCVLEHGGDLPDDFETLATLPGIGRSTAGAILAQAHGQRLAILDGNVKRTLARFHGVEGWPGSSPVEKKLWQLAESHLPDTRLADYTQAIMDFGATLCTRHDPACVLCPMQDDCVARREGRVGQLPEAKPGKPLPERRTLMLWVQDAQGRVLLSRRRGKGVWSGLWSLPETEGADAAREWLARHVAADFDAGEDLPVFEHVFSHYRLHIEPRRWRLSDAGVAEDARVGDNADLRWQPMENLHELGLPAPVKKLLGAPP